MDKASDASTRSTRSVGWSEDSLLSERGEGVPAAERLSGENLQQRAPLGTSGRENISLRSLPEITLYDPHRFLGLHNGEIRLWRPGAAHIFLEVRGEIVEAKRRSEELFTYTPDQPILSTQKFIAGNWVCTDRRLISVCKTITL